jgi:AraC-like DNA-binding protein
MKYIKSVKEHMSDVTKFVDKMKSKYNDFIIALKSERQETRVVYDLLNKAAKKQLVDENGQKRKLSEEEIKMIKQQTVDVLRMLGLTSLSILPGGTLALVLIKAFKQEDKILPSSFRKK